MTRRVFNSHRQSAILVAILLFSIAAPIHITQHTVLDTPDERHFTANNTANDSTVQTLMSNMNIYDPAEVTGVIDDLSRVHMVWVQDTYSTSLNYALFDHTGNPLISTTPIPSNASSSITSPAMVVDSEERAHIVWESLGTEIRYALIDPDLDDRDGSVGDIANMTLQPSTALANGAGTRSDPDIAVDSFDAAHVVWVDTQDPLGMLYSSPNIYYTMLAFDSSSGFMTVIGQTMVTQTISQAANPAVSVGANNTVVVVWEDTRGSTIEYVGILDTSGSMNTEWADMCVVFYGGYFASGGYFEGLKPLLQQSNITVMETLYALSGNWPSGATSGNCAAAYQTGGSGSQGPRNSSLSAGDDSGGIRELTEVVYNNGAVNLPADGGYYSEMWGPGSTWACLSWNDSSGNSPGNPPTSLDHHWNSTARKIVIPISDEGPYGGDPAQQSDDTQSINEAHDACVNADVAPYPLLAAGFGSGSTSVGSHMMDLAQCPNGFTSLNTRTCPGTNTRLTDAEGQMYSFPASASNSAELQLMVSAMVNIASGGSTEIFMTAMDPYSFINNPRASWSTGDPGSIANSTGNWYGEYTGPSVDPLTGYGNLVVINDTRLTNGAEWSSKPDVDIDEFGNVHVAWSDGRFNVLERTGPSQIHYMQIDPDRDGAYDGEPIEPDLTVTVTDSVIEGSNLTWGIYPKVVADSDGSVHLVWFETQNYHTDLRWARLQLPQYSQSGQLDLGQTLNQAYGMVETRVLSSGTSALMGVQGDSFMSGTQPIVSFSWPYRSILWTSSDCPSSDWDNDFETQLCIWSEVDYSMDLSFEPGQSSTITIAPGATTNVDMTLVGGSIPGGGDTVQFSISEIPDYWQTAVGYGFTYQSTIVLFEGQTIPIDLFLRAPDLRMVNENQSFDLWVTATSLTFEVSVASVVVHIDMVNLGDWDDDDGDGVSDDEDDCQWGDSDWISSNATDHDGDGCKDSTEDIDDDNDGHLDVYDLCPTGYMGNDTVDHDGDGCDDRYEDSDIDGDGVENQFDDCPDGAMHWDSSEDHDGDGCRDSDEDDNDDGDPYLDDDDDCPSGVTWWDDLSFDYDYDGCHDLQEDDDDDNDGVSDADDLCHEGAIDWVSSETLDWDGDGCRDFVEDEDNDNDGVHNDFDECPYGEVGWVSSPFNDWDGDGCKDISEDADDDNDGHPDNSDDCIRSPEVTAASVDLDRDGCDDRLEDDDLDNDGITSDLDPCEDSPLTNWVSTPFNDRDGDGCADDLDDDDDDNDGIIDDLDPCPLSPLPGIEPDYDSDGCMDFSEDDDDDNDGITDERDVCPTGVVGWISDSSNDRDADGCHDSMEDTDVPLNILETIRSSTALTMLSLAAIAMLAMLALSRSGGGSLLKDRKRRFQNPDESWALLDEKDPAPSKSRRRKAPPKVTKSTKPPDDEPEPTNSGSSELERAEEIIEELESAAAETSIDDLWDIADGKTPTPPTPSSLEFEPVLDEEPSELDDSGDPEDPITWLRLAGKMAAEGRHEEAEACRKTAMDLMQQNR
jgi:hypothetical protein